MTEEANMETRRKAVLWAVVLSETSHVFCCVLPTIFSVMSLLSGAGAMVMPAAFVRFHDFLHEFEMPMIFVSGLILALGWGVDWYARRIDCHDTGCGHGPCTPKKRKMHKLLLFATGLFVVNVAVYLVFHQNPIVIHQ